ncbi:hypothetical protein [Clostridium sp. BNL1100]|uniref:hypothetical protein n=1 Tax=Clostridium sp. BNL1100 TaxID=755731 RepID=UPI00024A777B|nr:hypothetical protein [Clostridium sp. BNL1100]AEY64337.1 hypothetical protein Clo1100_0044 [Clostridium sp. BNL1100]
MALYVAVISALITYISTAVVIKKIKTGEDEFTAVALGGISFAVLIGCIMLEVSGRV